MRCSLVIKLKGFKEVWLCGVTECISGHAPPPMNITIVYYYNFMVLVVP